MSQSVPVVLIVDDEPLIRELAGVALADAGCEVVEAANAAEALAVLKARPEVGVLFTDVNMPANLTAWRSRAWCTPNGRRSSSSSPPAVRWPSPRPPTAALSPALQPHVPGRDGDAVSRGRRGAAVGMTTAAPFPLSVGAGSAYRPVMRGPRRHFPRLLTPQGWAVAAFAASAVGLVVWFALLR
jgi:hypothetical protein